MCSWRSTTRVEHLIYDPQVRYVGAVGANDVLFASPYAGGLLVEESRLTERHRRTLAAHRRADHAARCDCRRDPR